MQIFGLPADDVALVNENTYDVWRKYNENANIQKVVNSFVDSTFSNDPKDFKQIYNELMFKNDEYLLLAISKRILTHRKILKSVTAIKRNGQKPA